MVIVLQSADLLSNLNGIPLQVIAKCFVVVYAISKLLIFCTLKLDRFDVGIRHIGFQA